MTRLQFALLLAMQIRRRPQQAQPKERDLVYPVFRGRIRELTRSRLTLDVEGGNTMDFRVQKSTRFFAGGKEAKPAQFKTGDEVAVECRHAPDASLDAVTVQSK